MGRGSWGAVALAGGLVLLAGVGAGARPAGADEAVGAVSFAFRPSAVTVAAGDTVTWRHEDAGFPTRPHTSISDPSQAEQWSSGPLTLDQTFAHTFTTPGTYTYYCAIGNHRALGMEGRITVGPATAASVCDLTRRSVANPTIAAGMCRLLQAVAADRGAREQLLAGFALQAEAAQRRGALTPEAAATLVRLARTL